jgi:hypothetical protein
MISSLSIQSAALALAIGSFAFAANANAYDDGDGDGKEAVIGIIGQVIGGAIAAEQANQQAAHCANLQSKCEAGKGWACQKAEAECGGGGGDEGGED